jgi:hypothetical protein
VAAPSEQGRRPPPRRIRDVRLEARPALLAAADTAVWVSGLVLAVSAFTSWYSGHSVEGPTLSVTGWNSGTIGKVVLLIGAAVVCLAALRRYGLEAVAPEPLIVVALGALATVFVLIRLFSIPDSVVGTAGRSIGLWISLASAIGVVASGLLQAAEEL